MAKRNILIVDDEQIMRDSIQEALVSNGYNTTVAEDGSQAKKILQGSTFDIVISDIKMPGLTGLELLKYIKEVSSETLVILMTAFGTITSAIEAMKEGAFDYLTKPFSIDALDVVLGKAWTHLDIVLENRYLKNTLEEKFGLHNFIGEHPKMKEVFEMIHKVANSKATVLVRGESGTGKELVARAIHYMSPRKNRPFIKVNCAALSSGLLESELFGHEKGSFTGAYTKKIGRFEIADGGTLLLDEISEIDIALQAKLLRVLQEKEFERVGGVNSIAVDVRIVATTNRDLEKTVQEGKFREDLYYRLHVVPLQLPALREKKSDIPCLMDYFLHKFAIENNKKISGFEQSVYEKLKSYPWPGNVRELENTIERAIVLSNGELLLDEYFNVGYTHMKMPPAVQNKKGEEGTLFFKEGITLAEIEKHYLLHMLTHCNGNKTKAAHILDISVRTLRNKLDEYEKMGLATV
ncbi:MAG: sigma-54 dependent transcriptional regulator [Candidatus Omnitrophota bacterium]